MSHGEERPFKLMPPLSVGFDTVLGALLRMLPPPKEEKPAQRKARKPLAKKEAVRRNDAETYIDALRDFRSCADRIGGNAAGAANASFQCSRLSAH